MNDKFMLEAEQFTLSLDFQVFESDPKAIRLNGFLCLHGQRERKVLFLWTKKISKK